MLRFLVAKRFKFALLVIFGLFYLIGLSAIPLVGPDEPRYAQVAREMFLRHDLVTPTLGGHTWFEKPALLYWLIIGCYRVFGVSEFSARFGPALCGILTFCIIAFLFSRVSKLKTQPGSVGPGDSAGLLAGIVTASTFGLIAFARGATFDIVLTATITFSLSAYFLFEIESVRRRSISYLAAFYSGIGLALLAKGLVGIVIPMGVIGLYYVFTRKWPRKDFLISLIWGIPLLVLVSLTWYGPVISRHGRVFVNEFFIQHHFARYVSDKYHHAEPVYYYILIIWLLALPWCASLVASIRDVVRDLFKAEGPGEKLGLFALSWVLVPVLFFSLSGSKLPGYILPSIPATAILVSIRFLRIENNRQRVWDVRFTGVLLLVIAAVAFVFLLRQPSISLICDVLCVAPLISAGIAIVYVSQPKQTNVIILAVALITSVTVAMFGVIPKVTARQSTRDLLKTANARGYQSQDVVEMHAIERTMEFYAGNRLLRAMDGEVLKLEGTSQLVDLVRSRPTGILVLIPSNLAYQLSQVTGLHTERISDNGDYSMFEVTQAIYLNS